MNKMHTKRCMNLFFGLVASISFASEASQQLVESATIFQQDKFDSSAVQNKKIGIVKTKWRTELVDAIYQDCVEQLLARGIDAGNILVCEVPGAYELTFGAHQVLEQAQCDVCICIGAVIGESLLADAIARTVIQGLHDLSLQEGKPVMCAVLATTYEQASNMIEQQIGKTWADSALAMLDLKIVPLA